MADSYSVKAILSAIDKGFSSTLKSALGTTKSLASEIKSGFAFGVLQGVGQQAFSTIKNSVSDLIGEMNSSNAAWKTFEGNLQILGKNEKYISSAKKSLQSYAEQTVYNSSDMAQTFAQLEAVGTKNTTKLVKGFGGLAAAAENPKQAMKTLSTQATQMAAKPTVAWQDFKLMLEQTPAGMAAVAKQMGMTSKELVSKIQAGEVATDDFFKAIEKVGNSKGFSKLATEYKTVEQATDGLKETISNKLNPAFDVLSKKGISAISGIADKISGIDAQGLANKLSAGIDEAAKYWEALKTAFSGVGEEINEAYTAIKESLSGITGAFGSAESVSGFQSAMQSVANVIKNVANFCEEHSETIAKLIKYLPAIVVGIKGFKIASAVAPGVVAFTKGIGGLASKGFGGLASKLFGTSKAQDAVGKSSATSGAKMLKASKSYALMGVAVLTVALGFGILAQSAIALSSAGGGAIGVMAGLVVALAGLGLGMAMLLKTLAPMGKKMMPVATAMLAMGAAVLMVSIGFAILAASSIALANAGGLAIGVMVGMVAAIALLAVGAALLGRTALTAGATGFLAFGAAVLMVGAGFALMGVAAQLAASALVTVSTVLPILAATGLQGAAAIVTLGASLLVFAAGAAVAGAAAIVLGAGLLVASAGVLLCAAGAAILAAAILIIGTFATIAATSLSTMAAVLPLVTANSIKNAASMAVLAGGLTVLGAAALVVGTGFTVLGAALLVVGVAMVTISAGMLLFSTASLIAATSIQMLSAVLPQIATHGMSGAAALAVLGAGMAAFAVGAGLAGAACLVLAAGLIATGASIAVIGAGVAVLAVGVLALAASFLAVSVAVLAVSGALAVLGLTLPQIATYGLTAAAAMVALSGGFIALGAGALVASAGCVTLGASIIVTTAAIIAFGAGMLVASAGVLAMSAGLKGISSQMKTISKNAKSAENSLNGMKKTISIVKSGLEALGSIAKNAMNSLINSITSATPKSISAGEQLVKGFVTRFKSGLSSASSVAKSIVSAVIATFNAGRARAYSAGYYISSGFASGMLSCLSLIRSTAAKMVSAANTAIEAKAKIASPSKVTKKLGSFYGEGFVVGISNMISEAYHAAKDLVSIPQVRTPQLAMAYSGELSSDYEYYHNAEYTIIVPIEYDGREVARVTAPYTERELNELQRKQNRKKGNR